MAVSPGSTTVGLAGLGNLGRPIAAALLQAGWSLVVLDRNPDRAGPLAEQGAKVASSPAELSDCDVLVLVVPDDAAVQSLLEGPEGYLSGQSGGRSVVVHSTVMPSTAARLGEVAAERGVGFLDAPVSGGAERAEKGDLTIMVGGEPDALRHARPLLDTLGSEVLHVGPAGAGAATKLANQLMMFAALAGTHEALDLAARYGVDESAVLAAVHSSTGDSWVARNWGFFDRVAAAYDEGGTPVRDRPWSKDLWEVCAAARDVDARVPLAALLAQTLAERVERHSTLVQQEGRP